MTARVVVTFQSGKGVPGMVITILEDDTSTPAELRAAASCYSVLCSTMLPENAAVTNFLFDRKKFAEAEISIANAQTLRHTFAPERKN